MVSQEILNAMDVISKSPMIQSISLSLRDYSSPEVTIQAHKDVPEYLVVASMERHLGELKLQNINLDFSHTNCWGNSYGGSKDGVEITLITSTTKEKPSTGMESNEEISHLHDTTEWTSTEIVEREA